MSSNVVTILPHPEPLSGSSYSAVELALENDAVILLEQRNLPLREEYVVLRDVDAVARAIKDLVVRGAPAIGITAAYAMVLAARNAKGDLAKLRAAGTALKASRPTAVNLAWAVDRMLAEIAKAAPSEWVETLAEAARRIHRQDVWACRAMGREGAKKVPDQATILTHCNAGALATGGYGSALGVIRAAIEAGKKIRVLADETRPVLQGARLTAWELRRDGIDVEVIADNSASWLMQNRQVDLVVVGADRIAANGDVANKIGTYQVAVSARFHEVPFYVAAPWSTLDLSCKEGALIPIEERVAREVTHWGDVALTPVGAAVRNPAFDVTPAKLVSAIFTERGTIEPVERSTIERLSTGQGTPLALD